MDDGATAAHLYAVKASWTRFRFDAKALRESTHNVDTVVTPDIIRPRRIEVGKLIVGAADDERILDALPAAATKAGAYSPTSVKQALKQRGSMFRGLRPIA